MTTLLFDVNETLSDLAPLADAAGSDDQAAAWFAATLRDGFALTVVGDNPSFAEVARAVATGMGLDADAMLAAMTSLGVHDDVVPGLRALAGHRLVTLSNGAASVAGSLLARAGVRDLVERTLSVADAGRWKPHPDAYGYALRELDVTDAVLVAVHPWDIDGAHRSGLRTAWLDRTGSPYPRHFSAPDIRITALTELAAAL